MQLVQHEKSIHECVFREICECVCVSCNSCRVRKLASGDDCAVHVNRISIACCDNKLEQIKSYSYAHMFLCVLCTYIYINIRLYIYVPYTKIIIAPRTTATVIGFVCECVV